MLVEVPVKLYPAHFPVVGLRKVKTSSNFPRAFLVHVPKCRKLRVDWCFTSSLGGCKIFLGNVPNTSHLPIVTLPLSERLIYLIIAVKISTGYEFTSRENPISPRIRTLSLLVVYKVSREEN